MTDFTTIIVPEDRDFIPSEEAVERGKLFLEREFPDYPVKAQAYSTPRFVTSGDNLEKYTCPRCRKLVWIRSLGEPGWDWTYNVLWQLRNEDQVVTVPCCGADVVVREFDFGTDAAFASFTLSVEGIGGFQELERIGKKGRQALESILGCRTRSIVEVGT